MLYKKIKIVKTTILIKNNGIVLRSSKLIYKRVSGRFSCFDYLSSDNVVIKKNNPLCKFSKQCSIKYTCYKIQKEFSYNTCENSYVIDRVIYE